MAMTQEKGRFNKKDALAVAEKIARKFGEPHPHLPKILEVIVFGSTARVAGDVVGDLDMVVFAEFTDDPKCRLTNLTNRLEEIEAELKREGVTVMPVDFLPLPTWYFTDTEVRDVYRRTMKDPNHVEKILSDYLRWDSSLGRFVRADLAYLKSKHLPS